MNDKITRRSFLKRAAYAGGSLALLSSGGFGGNAWANGGKVTATVVLGNPTSLIPGRLTDAPARTSQTQPTRGCS